MKNLFSSILFFLLSYYSYSQTPSSDPHWNQTTVWEDNFNTLNTNIWEVTNDFDHYGSPVVYTNRTDNVFINNGNLVLRVKSESYTCPTSALGLYGCYKQSLTGQPYSYTSGYIVAKLPYYIQYGYTEARIKLPYSSGLFPAFWTFTENPDYQEIDIFEMVPGYSEDCNRNGSQHFTHTNNITTSNVHTPPSHWAGNGCSDPYSHPSQATMQDYSQWHTYAIEWSPTRIIWYIDNSPYRYYHNSQINAPTGIILNLAIQTGVSITNNFPADMLVDYVKVYQLNEDCNDYINSTNYDFSTYNNIEKNYIRIGEGGGNNSLSSGDNVIVRASQYINIDGYFSVPLGASFYADANKDCPVDLGRSCALDFNPCQYNFSNYDNSIKRKIELGGNGCDINIIPTNNDILLKATNEIVIKPGITITPTAGKSVELSITECQ